MNIILCYNVAQNCLVAQGKDEITINDVTDKVHIFMFVGLKNNF